MSFGTKLRTLIEDQNLTQKEVALKLNIAPSTLGSYIQNAREPDFATLKSISRFFNVSTDYLLDNPIGNAATPQENELLQIYRSLEPEQRDICLEQCKVFVHVNYVKRTNTKTS